MQAVQPTTTITIDEAVFEVSSMSPQVQSMIAYLDDWRQKEVEATSELLVVRGALANLQNELLAVIQKEREDAAKASAQADADAAADPAVITDVEVK